MLMEWKQKTNFFTWNLKFILVLGNYKVTWSVNQGSYIMFVAKMLKNIWDYLRLDEGPTNCAISTALRFKTTHKTLDLIREFIIFVKNISYWNSEVHTVLLVYSHEDIHCIYLLALWKLIISKKKNTSDQKKS